MAKTDKEIKKRMEKYFVNLESSVDDMLDAGFVQKQLKGNPVFVKIISIPEFKSTATIAIVIVNEDGNTTAYIDTSYMNGIYLHNPLLDDTPKEINDIIFGELDALVDIGIIKKVVK